MKKLLLLTLISALLFTGCGKQETVTSVPPDTTAAPPETTAYSPPGRTFPAPWPDRKYYTFDAVVMKNYGDKVLLGDLGTLVGSIFYMSCDDETIKPGDIVEVTFNGVMASSDPPMLGDPSLKPKEQGTSPLPMLEEIFHELWDRDAGLNGNLELIAIDLDDMNLLSDIEKDAFVRIIDDYMIAEHDIRAIAANYDRLLMTQKLSVYGDNPKTYYFENGLIFSFETEGEVDTSSTSLGMSVTKWRSPLGAYGFTIDAKHKKDVWQYEIENEFIS